MFEDKRVVVTDLDQSQLEGSKKDDYIETKLKFTKIRICSLCSMQFCLLETVGLICCGTRGHRRDHVDFETECILEREAIPIPYKHYLCMLSDNCLPRHLQPTRDNTNRIKGLVGVRNHITQSLGSHEPEEIVVIRTANKRQTNASEILF